MDQADRPDYGPQNRNRKGQWGKWKGVICSVEGCDKPVSARGLCSSHYHKQKWADGHRPASVNPTSIRERHIKHRYGITAAEYDVLLAAQGGVCAICKRPGEASAPPHWRGKLCVDHDHDTGAVRGLLCNDCNVAAGRLQSAEVADALAAYFRLHDGADRQH